MNTTFTSRKYFSIYRRQIKKSSFDESSTIDSHRSTGVQDYKKKFKMEICKSWREYGACMYGAQCAFAHGQHELRNRALIAPTKYKTKQCFNFFQKGYCCYGNRCQFSHLISKKNKTIIHFERKLSYTSELLKIQNQSIDLNDLEYHLEEFKPNLFKQLANGIPVIHDENNE